MGFERVWLSEGWPGARQLGVPVTRSALGQTPGVRMLPIADLDLSRLRGPEPSKDESHPREESATFIE
jgi:hypothetical protein